MKTNMDLGKANHVFNKFLTCLLSKNIVLDLN